MLKTIRIVILTSTLLLLAACGSLAGEPEIVSTIPANTPLPPDLGYPASPPNITLGAAVFAENCTACHGVGGQGDGELVAAGTVMSPGDKTDRLDVAPDTPEAWFTMISNGNLENLMPPWGDVLTESERWSAAMYLYTLSYTPEGITNGEQVYAAQLADALPLDRLTNLQTIVQQSDEALFGQVKGVDPTITDSDVWDVVAYIRTQSLLNADAIGEVPAAPEPTTATLRGTVINGTAGAELPEDTTVTLFTVNGEFQTTTVDVPLNDDGSFAFEDVEVVPDSAYITQVVHRERTFFSEPVEGSALIEAGDFTLPITIYELTEDREVISIERIAIQISGAATGLQVAEFVFFNNSSDRVFTSSTPLDEEGTLFGSTVLSLPPGAIVVGFGNENPNRFIVSDEDFAVVDTLPVLPGEQHLMQVVYLLPYENEAIVEHRLNYALEGSARLLVRPTSLAVTSDQFSFLQAEQVGNFLYNTYALDDQSLSPNSVLSYDLRGELPATFETSTVQAQPRQWLPTLLFAISGVAGLAAVGLFVYSLSTSGKQTSNREISQLMAQIAHLDDLHETGSLNHDVWHQERNKLKDRLAEIMGESDA